MCSYVGSSVSAVAFLRRVRERSGPTCWEIVCSSSAAVLSVECSGNEAPAEVECTSMDQRTNVPRVENRTRWVKARLSITPICSIKQLTRLTPLVATRDCMMPTRSGFQFLVVATATAQRVWVGPRRPSLEAQREMKQAQRLHNQWVRRLAQEDDLR